MLTLDKEWESTNVIIFLLQRRNRWHYIKQSVLGAVPLWGCNTAQQCTRPCWLGCWARRWLGARWRRPCLWWSARWRPRPLQPLLRCKATQDNAGLLWGLRFNFKRAHFPHRKGHGWRMTDPNLYCNTLLFMYYYLLLFIIYIIHLLFQECTASHLPVSLIQPHQPGESLQDSVSLPMMVVGFSSFTTSSSDFMGGCSWANLSFSWVKLSRPWRQGEEDVWKTYQKQQASSWGRLFLSTRFNCCKRKTRFNSSLVWLVEGRSESKIEWDDTKEELGGDGGVRGGRGGGWHVYFGQNWWTTSVLVHLLEGLFS